MESSTVGFGSLCRSMVCLLGVVPHACFKETRAALFVVDNVFLSGPTGSRLDVVVLNGVVVTWNWGDWLRRSVMFPKPLSSSRCHVSSGGDCRQGI